MPCNAVEFISMNNFKFYAFTRFKLGVSAQQTHTELSTAHTDGVPGKSTIFRWFSEFKDGMEAAEVAGASTGHPKTIRTQEMIAQVEELIKEDCQMSTRFLAECLDVGKSTVHEILVQDLQLRNLSGVWVPHELGEEHKASRVNCAKHIRRLFFQEGMRASATSWWFRMRLGCTSQVNQASSRTGAGWLRVSLVHGSSDAPWRTRK